MLTGAQTESAQGGPTRGTSAGRGWLGMLAMAAAAVVVALWSLESAQAADDVALRLQLAQTGGAEMPRIAVLATVVAEPATQMPLQIRIAPTESIPRNSFLRLRGLPPTASLSEGYSIAPGAWAIPLNGLPRLRLNLPASVTGKSELVISLVDEDGKLLAEARVSLVIQPQTPAPAPPAPAAVEKERVAPPPRAQAPVLTPAERETAEKLVARGERDLQQGNIAQARQFFLRAAQTGLAQGALMLAATYDPRELARMRAVSVQPNIAEARKWYMRAVELGAPDAAHKLATLGGN
jgi:TPR repeat protein